MTVRTTQPGSAAQADPPEGKRARTRRALLQAARKVFDQRGVVHATIEEVAEAAGVSVGTVYSHFGSKDALALAFIHDAFSGMERRLDEARLSASPIERVLAAGDGYLQFVIDEPAASRYAISRSYLPPQDHEDEMARAISGRVQTALLAVASDLKTAMDEAEIPTLPIDEAMIFVWGAWMGVASMVLRQDGLKIPPETAARALALGKRILLAGLALEDLPAGLLPSEGALQAPPVPAEI